MSSFPTQSEFNTQLFSVIFAPNILLLLMNKRRYHSRVLLIEEREIKGKAILYLRYCTLSEFQLFTQQSVLHIVCIYSYMREKKWRNNLTIKAFIITYLSWQGNPNPSFIIHYFRNCQNNHKNAIASFCLDHKRTHSS